MDWKTSFLQTCTYMYLILPLPERKTCFFRTLTTKKHIKIIWNMMYIPGPKFWFPPGATDCTLWILFLQMGHVLQRKNRRNIGKLLQPRCLRHEEFVTVGHQISCQRRKHLSHQVPSLLLKFWSLKPPKETLVDFPSESPLQLSQTNRFESTFCLVQLSNIF